MSYFNDDHNSPMVRGIFRYLNHGQDMKAGEREALLAVIAFRILILSDFLIGLAWLLGAANRTRTPVYALANSAFEFMPGGAIRWWGGILVVLALGAAISSYGKSENRTMAFVTGIVMFWSYWLLNDVYSAFSHHGSLSAVPVVAITILGHIRIPLSSYRITPGAYLERDDAE